MIQELDEDPAAVNWVGFRAMERTEAAFKKANDPEGEDDRDSNRDELEESDVCLGPSCLL